MDFRQYDQALGRFNVMDALSEMAYEQTPYRYGFNNPVFWKDPSGLFETEKQAAKFLSDNGLKGSISYNSNVNAYVITIEGGEFDGDSYYEMDGKGSFLHAEIGGGKGGGEKDNKTLKQKYVDNLLTSHNVNSMLQMAYSIVGDVLIESTEYGEVLTNLREALFQTYGDQRNKRINEEISIIVSIVKAIKQNVDKGKISDKYFSLTGMSFLMKATELGIKNIAIEKQIQVIDNATYQSKILKKHTGGSFSGGGAGGNWKKNN